MGEQPKKNISLVLATGEDKRKIIFCDRFYFSSLKYLAVLLLKSGLLFYDLNDKIHLKAIIAFNLVV